MCKLKPVTPGELLLKEFLKPTEISQYRLAKGIGVPAQRIGDIVAGNALLPPTRTCASAGFLDYPMATGYEPKRPMTQKSKLFRVRPDY